MSTNHERGHMELVVKTYPNGFMSQYLASRAIGDKVDFRGPGGKMKYTRYLTREIGMIAGGSGMYRTLRSRVLMTNAERIRDHADVQVIKYPSTSKILGLSTLQYSIIKAVCTTEKDNTKIRLLFANKTEDDILLRKELDEYARKFPHKFKVWYILDSPPPRWQFGSGRIDKNLLQQRLPGPNGDESKILVCGPPGMQKAMINTLVELGFRRPGAIAHVRDQIFVF